MSHYWHLYCETCGDTMPFDANNGGDALAEVAGLAPLIAALPRAAYFDFGKTAYHATNYRVVTVSMNWLVEHGLHKLVVRGEYPTDVDLQPVTPKEI